METRLIIYQAAFELQSKSREAAEIHSLVNENIANWLSSKYESFSAETLLTDDFRWKGEKSVVFETKRSSFTEFDGVEIQVYKLFHADDEYDFKFWTTEFGVSICNDRVFLSIQTSTSFTLDFMGVPRLETAAPPRLIKMLLEHEDLSLIRGDFEVKIGPEEMENGAVRDFFDRLDRVTNDMAKVIVKGKNYNSVLKSGRFMARKLLGVAEVYVVHGKELEEEVKWELSKYDEGQDRRVSYSHRFRRNGITVFLASDRRQDWKEKRVRTKDISDELGIRSIATALNIKGFSFIRSQLKYHCFSWEEYTRLASRHVIEVQRKRGLDKEHTELWEDLGKKMSVEDELESAKSKIEELRSERDELYAEMDDLQNRLSFREEQQSKATYDLMLLEDELKQLRDRVVPMPENYHEFELYFSSIFSNVKFAERAFKTMKNVGGVQVIEVLNIIWQMTKVAEELSHEDIHGSIYVERVKSIIGSNWDLTLNESSTTKKDKEMMALRTFKFEGEDDPVVCEAHLKKGRNLRIYHSVKEGVLFIGHCGEHLKTAGTRRM